jgi:hypothetical protein
LLDLDGGFLCIGGWLYADDAGAVDFDLEADADGDGHSGGEDGAIILENGEGDVGGDGLVDGDEQGLGEAGECTSLGNGEAGEEKKEGDGE